MNDVPAQVFVWCFNTWAQWGGYARTTNLAPLNEQERATGAVFIRTDLHAAEVYAAYTKGFNDAQKVIEGKAS